MLVSRLFAVLSQTVRYIQALNVWKIFSQKENHELFHSSSLNISRVISTREGKLFSGLEFGSCLLYRTFDILRCWNKTQRISQIQYPFTTIYVCVGDSISNCLYLLPSNTISLIVSIISVYPMHQLSILEECILKIDYLLLL